MEHINLDTIKPAQNGPFQRIPDTFHGPKNKRELAMNLTKPVLDKLARNSGELPTTVGKTYDWSYGLTTLENRYLPEGFSFEDFSYDKLVEIEGLFARSWRWWQPPQGKIDLLTPIERFMFAFFTNVNADINIYDWKSYLSFDTPILLSKSELQRRLNIYYSTHPLIFDPHTGTFLLKQEPERILEQLEGAGVTKRNAVEEHGEDEIWDKDSLEDDTMLIGIDFYLSDIEKKLATPDPRGLFERELVVLKDASTHPIEKAARIWFFSHKHPTSPIGSAQAGKALAGIVLLTHGYIPPTISDCELGEALEEALPADNGVRIFTDFVARAVLKAQYLPEAKPTSKWQFCNIL